MTTEGLNEPRSINWAEEVEAESGLSTREEFVKDGIKTVIETMNTDDGARVRIKSTFKIEKKLVPKHVARRRHLKKFGCASTDPPGPNPAHTLISDDVRMQFIRNRAGELELSAMTEENPLKAALSDMHCRVCKQNDHWSKNCPYKDMIQEAEGVDETANDPMAERRDEIAQKEKSGKYIPLSMRGVPGGAPPTAFRMDARRDENTVRVTNLPEETMDQDLREIFSKVGKVNRIYLAKDKNSGRSKGFAFVTFDRRDEAEKAILTISGHKYDHLILKVEWARQNN